MDGWNTYVDAYCERLEPGFWAEPLNAVTNAAFIISALIVLRTLGKGGHIQARVLVVILCLIGIGSFLFHTIATRWAAMADVIPIAAFVLYFLYLANRYLLDLKVLHAFLATLLFFPYAPAATYMLGLLLPFLGGSAAYGSIALLIFFYSALIWKKLPEAARGLLYGGILLVISIGFRTADWMVCDTISTGTHMFWHIINAIMLGWMIHVMRRAVEDHTVRTAASTG